VAVDQAVAEALTSLEAQIAGLVIRPDDDGYDEARRVWNAMIDRHPLAIVRAGSIGDVAPTIAIAREHGLPLAVRGGGHNVAGNGTVDDGIVLDLGALNGVKVDPQARTARIEPGATLGDVDRATQEHGLAAVIGVVSNTGVAGLTLGGGVGWLTRPYGLSIDNLLAVELVTASGESVHASESENPELFWGVRGGGGNFGVVTSFTFRLHALGPSVFAGTLIYRQPRWTDALRAYAEWTRDQPDMMTSIITFMVPPVEWELGDEVQMFLGFAWAGADHAAGEAVVAPLRAAAPADVEVLDPTDWLTWQFAVNDMFPKGVRAYWKNLSFDRLDETTIAVIANEAGKVTWRGTAADIHHMGGAVARVPEDATPFPNRSAEFWLNIYGYWTDAADDPDMVDWVRGFHAAMEPHAATGLYVNFLGGDGDRSDAKAEALAAYGPAKFERLVALKRRYDPGNLCRLNHNIPPD
jgi:FAD/FMN-containing dehydrogenase